MPEKMASFLRYDIAIFGKYSAFNDGDSFDMMLV